MDVLQEFRKQTEDMLDSLFLKAKESNELAYVQSLLGLSSGEETEGWNPEQETQNMFYDLTLLGQAPLKLETQIRLYLYLYCHLIEANFIYHILFNMLLAIENQTPPKLFNVLDYYQKEIPPKAKSKSSVVIKKAEELKCLELATILRETFDFKIRNAVLHSDYIMLEDRIRFKHDLKDTKEIGFEELTQLMHKMFIFFDFFQIIRAKHMKSYTDGHIITNRKSPKGKNLSDIEIKVTNGYISGFSTRGLLNIW